MIINGLKVYVQHPTKIKTKKFSRWGVSKSKVGRRYVKLYKVVFEDLISDDKALIYKDKIIVSPKMYERLKHEIKEPQSNCSGFPNINNAGCGTYSYYR